MAAIWRALCDEGSSEARRYLDWGLLHLAPARRAAMLAEMLRTRPLPFGRNLGERLSCRRDQTILAALDSMAAGELPSPAGREALCHAAREYIYNPWEEPLIDVAIAAAGNIAYWVIAHTAVQVDDHALNRWLHQLYTRYNPWEVSID